MLPLTMRRLLATSKARLRPLAERVRQAVRAVEERVRPRRPWDGHHHPVLAHFPPWEGESDGTTMVDFLGVRTDPAYRPQWRPSPPGPFRARVPSPYAGYFEWLAVLESVIEARDAAGYSAVELGAGFGPWLVTAHRAMAVCGGPPVRLVGVEMVPRHFAWMREHMRRNGIDPGAHRLMQAAASDRDGTATFVPERDPYHTFGQRLAGHGRRGGGRSVEVPTVCLATALDGIDRVDLLHVDVQGQEARVLAGGIATVRDKVRRLVVGTHSARIHRTLRRVLGGAGLESVWDYRGGGLRRTEFGDVRFLDGLLVSINPRLR